MRGSKCHRSRQWPYADAFDKAVRACRDLNLTMMQSNRDSGQIQCSTIGAMEGAVAGKGYWIDVLLDKDRDALKQVDVKTMVRQRRRRQGRH
jgi:hypothetical protein